MPSRESNAGVCFLLIDESQLAVQSIREVVKKRVQERTARLRTDDLLPVQLPKGTNAVICFAISRSGIGAIRIAQESEIVLRVVLSLGFLAHPVRFFWQPKVLRVSCLETL